MDEKHNTADEFRGYRTFAQVAKELGISHGRVCAMRREGLIYAIRTPLGWLVPDGEVARLKILQAERRLSAAAKKDHHS